MLGLLPVEPFLRPCLYRCAGRCKLLQPYFVAASTPSETRLDWIGQTLAILALLCLTGTVIEAPRFGWSSFPVCAGLTVAIMATAAFLTQEHRCKHPMLPLRFFCDRRFLGATLVGFLINMTLYGALFVLGLYFQVTRHWPAWVSGIAFLPLPAVLGIANILASRIADRLGPSGCMSAGLLIAASGCAVLSSLGAQTAYGEMLVGLVLIPAGAGIAVPVMTSSLLGSVPRSQAGVASGTLNAIRQAGGAIGVALFGALPIHPAFLLGSGLMVAASAAAACLIRSTKPVQRTGRAGAAARSLSQ